MIDTLNRLDNRLYLFTLTLMIFLFDVFTHQNFTELTRISLLGFVTYIVGQADGKNQIISAQLIQQLAAVPAPAK
jgi:hypothetical protein